LLDHPSEEYKVWKTNEDGKYFKFRKDKFIKSWKSNNNKKKSWWGTRESDDEYDKRAEQAWLNNLEDEILKGNTENENIDKQSIPESPTIIERSTIIETNNIINNKDINEPQNSINNTEELQPIHNELHSSLVSNSISTSNDSQSNDSKSNSTDFKLIHIKPKKSKATIILQYIINKIIKNVSIEIATYYDSNYPGYVLNTISNLLIKYFCIKYDKPNILNSDFFKDQEEFQTIEDLSDKLKPIITEQRCRLNYIQNKIFYTWENFQFIINFIEKTYMADPSKMNDTNPNNKRINSQYKNRSKSLSPQSPNKKNKPKKNSHKNNYKNRNSKINRRRSLSPINRRYSLFD